MLIESGGAVFEATNYYWPERVWNVSEQRWEPYEGPVPKPEGWGDVITQDQAREFMAP